MDIRVRELRISDFRNGFLEIVRGSSKRSLAFDEAKQVLRERNRRGVHTYIAVVDDKVVGTASLIIEQKFIHRGAIVGRVEDVSVCEDWQGKGVGSALMFYILVQARGFGCYKITLSCHSKFVNFYEKHEYKKWDVGMRLDLVSEK